MKKRSYRKGGRKTYKRNRDKSLRRMVRTEISRATENSHKEQTTVVVLRNDPANVAWIDNVRDCGGVLRSITQGTNTGNRLGSKIKLKKCMYNFTLYPNTNIENSFPTVVKMWVISDRFGLNNASTQNIVDACKTASTGIGNILEDTVNNSVGFFRDVRDLITPINKERFKVYTTRTFKIAPLSAPTTNSTIFSYGNNDFKLFVRRRINLLKYMPKIFKYQDAGTNLQFNRKVFVLFQVVCADGTVQDENYINLNENYDVEWEG